MSLTRRGFFRSLAAAVVGFAVAPHLALAREPTQLFTTFVNADRVGEFEVVYYWQGELLCNNPRRFGVITGIAE